MQVQAQQEKEKLDKRLLAVEQKLQAFEAAMQPAPPKTTKEGPNSIKKALVSIRHFTTDVAYIECELRKSSREQRSTADTLK